MVQFLSTLAGAATIFASTNVDDLFVASAFFSERRPHWPTIVVGQFLGIGALVVASTLIALATLTLPTAVFPYLGTIPLGLGLRRLWQWWRTERDRPSSTFSDSPDDQRRRSEFSSNLLTVTTVTIANGSDNLAVYVPFFAKRPPLIPFYAVTFALLTALWCLLAYLLVNHSPIVRHVRRLGHVTMAVVMILIGLSVLGGSVTENPASPDCSSISHRG